MLFLRLWNYLRGYVIILVEGFFLEKFINICIRRQIFLWDVKRQKSGSMTLKLSIKGFRLLRPIAKKTGCRVRIIKKRGLPFIMNRYKRRKTFLFGAVVFIALIFILTSFIWTIEITGLKKLDSSVLANKLEEYGIRQGTLKYGIYTDKLVNNLMTDVKELAWVGIEVRGTKLKIEIAERVTPPQIIPKDQPCDIIAKKDGVIKSIVATAGQDMVKAGVTVQKGQLLIAGTVPNKNPAEKSRLVHAAGTVKARTWYEKTAEVNTNIVERERTGIKKNNYALVLFNKRIDIFPGRITFENFDKIDVNKRLSFGKDLELPFTFATDTFYEIRLVEREINLDEAKSIAAETAQKEMTAELPEGIEIIKTTLDFREKEDGSLYAEVIAECIEDIGIENDIQTSGKK